MRKYFQIFEKWSSSGNEDLYKKLCILKSNIINAFKLAKISDRHFVHMGQLKESIFLDFPVERPSGVKIIINMFLESIGYFKTKALEAVNPLFWIEMIAFLPIKLFDATNLELTEKLNKIVKVLLESIYVAILIILAVLKNEIVISFLKELFN